MVFHFMCSCRIHASHSHDEEDEEEEDDGDGDFASIGHASSTGPAADSVMAFDQDDQSHHSHQSLHSDVLKQTHEREKDGTRTPPPLSSRPQSRENEGASATTATASDGNTVSSAQQNDSHSTNSHNQSTHSNSHSNSHHNKHQHAHSPAHKQTHKHTKKQDPKKQDVKLKKASSPISGAIGALISNLSGKSRTHKAASPKVAHSPSHHEKEKEKEEHETSARHAPNVVCATPAEGGPVQKFYQLITLRGRNVVIRPAVNISHDTVVLYY